MQHRPGSSAGVSCCVDCRRIGSTMQTQSGGRRVVYTGLRVLEGNDSSPQQISDSQRTDTVV